jgi:hypothetical protein
VLEYLSLELHFYAGVYELHYNGCHHAVGGTLYIVNRCGCTVNSSFGNSYILCEHNKAPNSYCLNMVELSVKYKKSSTFHVLGICFHLYMFYLIWMEVLLEYDLGVVGNVFSM